MPSPVTLPRDEKGILKVGLDLINICRASAGQRAAAYRAYAMIANTGRQDGSRSMINMMHRHLDRVASHLFSPTELRFAISFDEDYPEEYSKRAQRAALLLTRDWQRSSTDMMFSLGVVESLKYGACFLKQWPSQSGGHTFNHNRALVMPWQIGFYREDVNDIKNSPAVCETMLLTMPEVWRRIYHLPDADRLYKRIEQHAQQGSGDEVTNSFFHQVLSTGQLNTSGVSGSQPAPGGIVQVTNGIVPSDISIGGLAPMVKMHELWVWDDDDYTTIQVIEPDILIAPLMRKSNLLISSPLLPEVEGPHQPKTDPCQLHPYTLIQPNQEHGTIWGRSELADLIEPQDNLASMADDQKRALGLVIDKILGFSGDDGITDDAYDQMRMAGYYKSSPGSSIVDLTPKFPTELPAMIEQQIKIIEMVGGLEGLMAGRGEPGVRAGTMQDKLIKTASPGLRDRSLLVERQCAEAADLWLTVMEAKEPTTYWTDGRTPEAREKTSFILADLPGDRFVQVDSHSGSPIFADDHMQLTMMGLKTGMIAPEDALEDLPFPNKEVKQQRLKGRNEKREQMMKQLMEKDPQALEKLLGAKSGRGHH